VTDGRDAAFVVRPARVGDAVSLHLIAAATFPLACVPETPQSSIATYIDENLSVERFRSHLTSHDISLFIAEVNGTPAGYALLDLAETRDAEVRPYLSATPSVELDKFYLLAGRHGSGLADDLMRAVLAEAREHAAASLWLSVGQRNDRANAFYDRYGFERRGPRVFPIADSVEADLVRELVLA
jgi:ribosomal protein S18 acetylase RimI-like enzyme